MIVRRVCVAITALSMSVISAQPVAAEPLKPARGWVLDYAETQCLASRAYGDPNNSILLGIRPAPNGETYELFVARHHPGPDLAEELHGSVDFGRGPINAWLLHYRPTDGKKPSDIDVYQFRIPAADMAQARSAAAVTFLVRGAPDYAFTLASIPKLLDGLEACTADLKKYWNMDGEKLGQIATPAKGDIRGVFTGDDYPWEALSRGQEGKARYLLLIDEKGAVAGCHVLEASGVPALDVMGCIVIRKRAKFKPALDRNGKPLRDAVVTPPVSWRIEG